MSNQKPTTLFTIDGPQSEADLNRLYNSTARLLLHIAMRIVKTSEAAEDIVHDSFMRLVEKRMSFPSLDDAKYWLIRVVKNASLNYSKRKGREVKALEKWWKSESVKTDVAEDVVLRKESTNELKENLDKLPESLKSVLILKEYGGLSYKEIGKTLGISEGNVKVRAFRAREALLAKYKEKEASEQ